MKWFNRKKKPLSADVIRLLAQAHSIHKAELEFAKDEAREEARAEFKAHLRSLGEEIREALFGKSDSIRSAVGVLLVDEGVFTPEEWNDFVNVKKAQSAEQAVSGLQQARAREAHYAAQRADWANTDRKYPLSAKA